ncbi:hypothetical protein GCM10022252_61110 [Streptosporangium oxazolinicum]|uniref:Uncharacterized protein n=1 Tax=Streptosporangium oxazolinicum TaxID=909287 RepID=A0ABP8BDS4_9ACTN
MSAVGPASQPARSAAFFIAAVVAGEKENEQLVPEHLPPPAEADAAWAGAVERTAASSAVDRRAAVSG